MRSFVSLYVVWLIVVPPPWVAGGLRDLWRGPQLWVHEWVGRLLGGLGLLEPSLFVRVGAYYLFLSLVVPVVGCVICGRFRPRDTGWRRPNRLLFRIVLVSFIVAMPFLFWMVRSPDFAGYYRTYMEAGSATVLIYYVVVLFCEHFFFEGVMLAWFRADGRWPDAPVLVADATTGWRRLAQWFGVAQPTGSSRGIERVTRWLGIPDGCFGAILLSGVLFGLIHWGKAGREFLLAFPGGVFLAVLAYRCNSWHAPYLLHAGTVTGAGVLFLMFQD